MLQAAEQAYSQHAEWKLNSIEGFVRQILGWREYVRGIYLYMDEDYGDHNWFDHAQPLPRVFTGQAKRA